VAKSFFKITNKDELEQLISNSKTKPVVVFKHSTSCPISSRAYREMEQVEGDVNVVVIQNARDVSREVEQVTGVRHESPQVIVLKDGKAVWTASHYDVQAGAVAEAVEANS
jgi:bacillithiol system protein YtxJ